MPTTSRRLKERRIASILLLAMPSFALSACVTASVTPASASCAALLPQEWKAGVPDAELDDPDTIGGVLSYANAQSLRLDMANGRTRDSIAIVERCEARDAAAVKKASRGFFGRLLS